MAGVLLTLINSISMIWTSRWWLRALRATSLIIRLP